MRKLQGVDYDLRHNADRGPLCSCSTLTGPRSSFIPDALRWLHVRRATVRTDPAGAGRAPAAAAAPKAPAAPSFVPEDIDTPVVAAQKPSKPADMTDIDEIFSIFKR